MPKMTYSTDVEFIDCCSCGMTFGMTEKFIRRRRQDGALFYCPQGHEQQFIDSELDKVRRERDQLKQSIAWYDERQVEFVKRLEEQKRQISAARGQATKLAKRAAAGLCPCCNRSFASSQMARHMATKHPTFKAEAVQ